jgi:hypothetical protein
MCQDGYCSCGCGLSLSTLIHGHLATWYHSHNLFPHSYFILHLDYSTSTRNHEDRSLTEIYISLSSVKQKHKLQIFKKCARVKFPFIYQ